VTWLTWRQFRAQTVVTSAALAVLAIVLLITGLQLSHTFDTTVIGCRARGDCTGAINALQSQDTAVQDLARLLVDRYDGDPAAVWTGAATGKDLVARLAELPGFGGYKAQIFAAMLGKQLGGLLAAFTALSVVCFVVAAAAIVGALLARNSPRAPAPA